MERHERLKHARQKRFRTAREAATYLDIPYGTYTGHESGARGIKDEELDAYAATFRVSRAWLAFGEGDEARKTEVPVMGRIGAGAEIWPEFEQVPPDGLWQIDLPFPVPDEMIAFEVEGPSMLPRYDEGDVIVVYRDQRRPLNSFIGEEAAVRTAKGRRFLKRIARGPRRDTVNLESFNARTIEGVHLEWIGEIWLTVRAGQLRRIEQRERAESVRRQRSQADDAARATSLDKAPGND